MAINKKCKKIGESHYKYKIIKGSNNSFLGKTKYCTK